MENVERAKVINEKLGREAVTVEMLNNWDNGESLSLEFDVLIEIAGTTERIE